MREGETVAAERLAGAEGATVSGPLATSRSRSQSPSPAELAPGGAKVRDPVLAKGDPAMADEVPEAGSNQLAETGPASFAMLTVRARGLGMYAMARVPSGVRAAVA